MVRPRTLVNSLSVPVCEFLNKFQRKHFVLTTKNRIAWFTSHHTSSSCTMHHASCIMHHASCIMHHATSKQGMRLKFGMLTVFTNIRWTKVLHHISCIEHHASGIIHHASWIMHDAWCMIHDASCIMLHASCIMHHASSIMHHASCIMHHAAWLSRATLKNSISGVSTRILML